MEILTLAGGVVGLAVLTVMAVAPLVADLPLPRRVASHRTAEPAAAARPTTARAA